MQILIYIPRDEACICYVTPQECINEAQASHVVLLQDLPIPWIPWKPSHCQLFLQMTAANCNRQQQQQQRLGRVYNEIIFHSRGSELSLLTIRTHEQGES